MTHRLFKKAVSFISLLCMVLFASCGDDSPTGSVSSFIVSGKVVDSSGNGMSGVNVSISGIAKETDSSGNYRFEDIDNGVHSIKFAKDGYIFPSTRHAIVNGKNVTVDDVTESDIEGLTLVPVPAGSFSMGDLSGTGNSDELPVHEVWISAFQMSAYETTQAQYEAIMGVNPSAFTGENLPVDQVTWYSAAAFCNKLSIQAGLTPCYNEFTFACDFSADGFRLPTEAEWEYACRAGTATDYYTGDDESGISSAGWYSGNGDSQLHPVGGKEPNAWGLYDMHGNAEEWCNDRYGSDYYASSPATDPAGPESDSHRVVRGGSSINESFEDGAGHVFPITADCRSASRTHSPSFYALSFDGFRVVRRP